MIRPLNDYSLFCHGEALRSGWWEGIAPGDHLAHAGKIALIHSEISEALEGYRTDATDKHLPHRPSVEVELADALIRIFDLAGRLNLDLGGAVDEKMTINRTRADHDPENRKKKGGKKF